MIELQLVNELLGVLPLRKSVYWTPAFFHRKIVFALESDDVGLIYKHHWPYHGQTHPVQIGLWGERMETSLKDQGKNHRFHDVILVVGVSHLIVPKLFDCFIEGAFSHLGTQRAWIAFLTLFKKNMRNISFYHMIWHPKLPAESIDLFCVEFFISKVYGYGGQFKRLWIKPAQSGKSIEQCEAVLSSGDADSDLITGLDHLVFIYRFPCKTEQLL